MSDEFDAAIEEAKRLEKKQVEYAPYNGDITLEKTLDLEPRDYVDLRYPDLINLYERSQKIISTANLGILAGGEAAQAAAPPQEMQVGTGDVESRLREMTSETLKAAEEVAKEPMAIEHQPDLAIELEKHEEAKPQAVEFESRTVVEQQAAETAKFELPKAPEMPPVPAGQPVEPQQIKQEEAKPAAPAAPAAPIAESPIERKVIVAAVPPALRESPDKAASKRYEKMEEQVRSSIGDKADEMELKKKMLELTKQLFKEKTTSRREELKLQITVLKNMLAGVQVGGTKTAAGPKKAGGGASGAEADTHVKLLETMLSTQQAELAQTKDGIIDSYNKQVAEIKKKFYDQIASTEDAALRKKAFEAFVFSVESLVEQLPDVMKKYQEFTAKKHSAEMEKLRDSLGSSEKDTLERVNGRIGYINGKYDTEFASVKGIVGRQIENLIEVAGTEIFKRQDEKPKESEARVYETVKEINETDEGTLLYFLHGKDPEQYKKYERKQVSKAEAIFKAKELMAKDKGLSESVVKKYFSQTEG